MSDLSDLPKADSISVTDAKPGDVFRTKSPWGDGEVAMVVSSTRKSALEDGTYVSMEQQLLTEAGVKMQGYYTGGLHATLEPDESALDAGQSLGGRTWDMLNVWKRSFGIQDYQYKMAEKGDDHEAMAEIGDPWSLCTFELLVRGRKLRV